MKYEYKEKQQNDGNTLYKYNKFISVCMLFG